MTRGGNPKLWETEFEVAHDGQPGASIMQVSRSHYTTRSAKFKFVMFMCGAWSTVSPLPPNG